MKAKLILLVVLNTMFFYNLSHPQTQVSGTVSGTWSQGNTYEVVGDIYVLNGTSLTIEHGVTVKFMGYYRFYIYGLLNATGTQSDSIFFTTDTLQNPNRWGGIRFTNADSLSSMSYCVIEYGFAQGGEPHGGGIYCSNSSPTIYNCTIKNNSANEDGGGIAFFNWSSPDISNCTISRNFANLLGGGIRIGAESYPTFNHCIISENSADIGGGLGSWNSTYEFKDCQFIENYALGDNGGGISCYSSELTFISCDIINNHLSAGTEDAGGGIFVDGSSIVLTSCNITGNYNASYGGGISIQNNSSIEITNCNISYNSASLNGGGILIYSCTDAQWMKGCTISNNTAGGRGGGISLGYSTIGIYNCEISNNTAFAGGGLFLNAWWASIKNSDFISNNAIGGTADNAGGGICIDANGGVDLTNCLFQNNSSGQGGGVCGLYWSSESTIDSCTFINNSANPQGGGGIFNNQADIKISDCFFEGNQTIDRGGAINNNIASSTITKCVIYDNTSGYYGGGIYNGNGGSPTISRCTIYGNSALSGGGIANVGSTPKINSVIINSSSNGFGIYFGNGSANSIIEYCDLNSNLPDNFSGSDIPVNLGTIATANSNGDPCDIFYNLYLDPLFVDDVNGNFNLQSNSPCIDAGDPNISSDPDSTIADIGAYYYDQPVGVIEKQDLLFPISFKLRQNYPNPFNPTTKIKYEISKTGLVTLKVYDILGGEVATLVNEEKLSGSYEVEFNGSNLSSGVYFFKLQAGSFVETKKMILLR